MEKKWVALALAGNVSLFFSPLALASKNANFAGSWDVIVSYDGGSSAGVMSLRQHGQRIEGESAPLDENRFLLLKVEGLAEAEGARLSFFHNEEVVGTVALEPGDEGLVGAGTLFGEPFAVRATPSAAPSPGGDRHEYLEPAYHLRFWAGQTPALRVKSGDSIETKMLDSAGRDETLTRRAMPGNTLTGPFYIEGAMPGDTLAVRFDRISPNRDTASMSSGVLKAAATQPTHIQNAAPTWSRDWILDHDQKEARLKSAGTRLDRLRVAIDPMIGTIGVAPPFNQAIYAIDLGVHGGNLDYRGVKAGATIYLPVFQPGALLSIGDGHAAQGDGEISGQGLETSLDVAFTVTLIKNESLDYLWLEDSEFVMTSGIEATLDAALKAATTGMAKWLRREYKLNDSEIAALLGSSVRYEVAEIVSPKSHMVAKISKKTLDMLGPRRP